eukprot:1196139-Prorocentrum_minimum.AAC.3
MDSVDSVCQAPMEHQMKCAAMVAALARADSAIYGDLVTNLTARSFSDINKITLAEIRSLANFGCRGCPGCPWRCSIRAAVRPEK